MKKFMFAFLMMMLISNQVHADRLFGEDSDDMLLKNEQGVKEPVFVPLTITVEDKKVYLGDIFTNISSDIKDIAITVAPLPGRVKVLDASYLSKLARAYKIDWRPKTHYFNVRVTRKSRHITQEEITKQIKEYLDFKVGLGQKTMVEVTNANLSFEIPVSKENPIKVVSTDYNPRTNRFISELIIKLDSQNKRRVRVNGRVYSKVEVPILKKNVKRGEIVQDNDIKWIEARSDNLRNNAITEIDSIVGKQAKRMLKKGRQITKYDLKTPVLVDKGEVILMSIKTPFMRIVTKGAALEEGGKGDVIKMKNLKSGKTILAVVNGKGSVSIGNGTNIALN